MSCPTGHLLTFSEIPWLLAEPHVLLTRPSGPRGGRRLFAVPRDQAREMVHCDRRAPRVKMPSLTLVGWR